MTVVLVTASVLFSVAPGVYSVGFHVGAAVAPVAVLPRVVVPSPVAVPAATVAPSAAPTPTPQSTPKPSPKPVTPAPPARVTTVTPVPPAADLAPAVPGPSSSPDPFTLWLEHPTFTCDPGFAPGWLNEAGLPTGCVAN